ncbi:MAG: ribosome maturation factor RimP [Lachnospiraceae bacterium]|nr:ribosome maturation factor RimP [Lachnospiraceae bacterium]
MLKRAEVEQRCEALVQPILDEHGFELWDVEYVKEGANYYLRVYADKEGGITIDDCVTISRALEGKLDEEDFISEAYILEVSSPGLGRPLKRERDFARSIGAAVDVKLYQAVNQQKEYTGILKAYDEKKVILELEETEMEIQRNEIALIRLAFDF